MEVKRMFVEGRSAVVAAMNGGLVKILFDDGEVRIGIPVANKLSKEWTASASATSGITAYGSTGRSKERRKKERRVKLLPTKET